jgi:WD40 repeat protein
VAASPKGQERATLRGHLDTVRSLAFLDGGRSLATRGEDGLIKVWDLGAGPGFGRERLTLGGAESRVRCMRFTNDGRILAAGLRNPRPRATPPPGEVNQAPVIEDRPEAAQPAPPEARSPVEAKVWSLVDGRELASLSGHNGDIVTLDFTADGKTLATASRNGVVKLWDGDTFKVKLTPSGRQGGVDLVAFSADGKTLVGANAAGLVTLWDVDSGKPRATFTHFGGMNMIVLSPDGKVLATGGGEVGPGGDIFNGPGDVRLWDVASGRRLAVLPAPSTRVTRLAFAPDGKTLAASTEAPSVMLWDVVNAAPRAELTWPSGPARYLAFSPDGKTLATGGDEESLRLWDAASGTPRATLRGHADAIGWIAFSPDGKTIATASRDATAKLWDAPAARPEALEPSP